MRLVQFAEVKKSHYCVFCRKRKIAFLDKGSDFRIQTVNLETVKTLK